MDITNLIYSDIKIIQVISHETRRVINMAIHSGAIMERDIYFWSASTELRKNNLDKEEMFDKVIMTEGQVPTPIKDIVALFQWFLSDNAKSSILVIEEFGRHLYENTMLISILKRFSMNDKLKDRALIFVNTNSVIPSELSKIIYSINLDYPNKEEISSIYNKVIQDKSSFLINAPETEIPDKLLSAALGLTDLEIERSFSKAIVDRGSLTNNEYDFLIEEKKNLIKNCGFLELYDNSKLSLTQVGGMQNLKRWLNERRVLFSDRAKQLGLGFPKGILLLGIPGTGKSLVAKTVGSEWEMPVIRLDIGRIFDSFVGASEKNIDEAIKRAEACSPSILWIDEIEKGLSTNNNTGRSSGDGGVSARVISRLLTWMQEKSKPVFIIATANSIEFLPPELLRKGRFDEIFFVDLPDDIERENIARIHLSKYNLDEYFETTLAKLIVDLSKGFSGVEIEEGIKNAIISNLYLESTEILSLDSLTNAFNQIIPLSQSRQERIQNMREWAKGRALFASTGFIEDTEYKLD